MKIGCLYIVATPIGNYQDITLRALQVLRDADAVICEEFRQGSTLLKKLDIPSKELLQLNEHNEAEKAPDLLQLLLSGKRLALVSDCGTPAFADPGTQLVKLAMEFQVPVVPVPGVSSLMALISISPLSMDNFYFAGFLPRKTVERQTELKSLLRMNVPIILMDTPYRLEKLLLEIRQTFGKNCLVTLAMDLTLDSEEILHGSVTEVLLRVKNRKSEFMLIVH
jgi:16S rRNA (cytidine1402-2'-O)-methyltransferase